MHKNESKQLRASDAEAKKYQETVEQNKVNAKQNGNKEKQRVLLLELRQRDSFDKS